MTNWNYQREEDEMSAPVTGKKRCVIVSAEESVSKTSGNPMIIIGVRPSGFNFTVKEYLVQNDRFNMNATKLFDCFPSIGEGNFNLLTWIGAEGAALFDEDERGFLRVKRWLYPKQAANLPPFEGEKPEQQEVTSLDDPEEEEDDDEMPFDI